MSTGRQSLDVSLLVSDEKYEKDACRLSERYGFAVSRDAEAIPEDSSVFLSLDSSGLSLVSADNHKERVLVDYLGGRSGYRLSTMVNTAQPVLKAIGFNKDKAGLKVLDATAGLGVDGMTMAAAGCRVRLLERSPVMAALLEDAFQRVIDSDESNEIKAVISERVELERVDSINYFAGIADNEYDVIYLDPMFPERKKSSKVKKEMKLTRFITDLEDNALEMLGAALATPVKRVVIKRPLKAPVLKKGFSSQIKGKSIRFDVFIR